MSDLLNLLTNLDLQHYHNIYVNVHEMLAARGYTPVEEQESLTDYKSRYLGILCEKKDRPFEIIDAMSLIFMDSSKKRILVYFYPLKKEKLSQSHFQGVQKCLEEGKCDNLLLIADSVTPKISNSLPNIGDETQWFTERELSFNKTMHQLVPRHTRMSKDDEESMLRIFCDDGGRAKLPGIATTDPIVKYHNWPINAVIQIERPRPDGHTDMYYRCVMVV